MPLEMDDVFTTEASDSEQDSARRASSQMAKEREKSEEERGRIDDNLWEVDKALRRKWSSRQKCFLYEIRWKGWSEEHNEWVPEQDVTDAVKSDFKERLKRRNRQSMDDFIVPDDVVTRRSRRSGSRCSVADSDRDQPGPSKRHEKKLTKRNAPSKSRTPSPAPKAQCPEPSRKRSARARTPLQPKEPTRDKLAKQKEASHAESMPMAPREQAGAATSAEASALSSRSSSPLDTRPTPIVGTSPRLPQKAQLFRGFTIPRKASSAETAKPRSSEHSAARPHGTSPSRLQRESMQGDHERCEKELRRASAPVPRTPVKSTSTPTPRSRAPSNARPHGTSSSKLPRRFMRDDHESSEKELSRESAPVTPPPAKSTSTPLIPAAASNSAGMRKKPAPPSTTSESPTAWISPSTDHPTSNEAMLFGPAEEAAETADQDEEFVVEDIIEHGSAADMAVKYKSCWPDHWQIKERSLEEHLPEATVFRVRWRDYDEGSDTFELETRCRGPALDRYAAVNCRGLGRYLMPTEETMRRVRDRLRLGRRELTCIDQLEAAAQDINVHLPRGQDASAKLQRGYPSWNTTSKDKWRLVYVLLDAGTPGLTATCDFRTFARSLFYVGKGVEKRPFEHLEQAKDLLLKGHPARPTRCAKRIADIWRNGDGVVVLPAVTKACNANAKCREAAVISLQEVGLTNLLNSASGSKGLEQWSDDDWTELGVLQLISAFKLYREAAQRSWYLWDVPLKPYQLRAWHSAYPTPYSPDVVEERPGTLAAHALYATARPHDGDDPRHDGSTVPQRHSQQVTRNPTSSSQMQLPAHQLTDAGGSESGASSRPATASTMNRQTGLTEPTTNQRTEQLQMERFLQQPPRAYGMGMSSGTRGTPVPPIQKRSSMQQHQRQSHHQQQEHQHQFMALPQQRQQKAEGHVPSQQPHSGGMQQERQWAGGPTQPEQQGQQWPRF